MFSGDGASGSGGWYGLWLQSLWPHCKHSPWAATVHWVTLTANKSWTSPVLCVSVCVEAVLGHCDVWLIGNKLLTPFSPCPTAQSWPHSHRSKSCGVFLIRKFTWEFTWAFTWLGSVPSLCIHVEPRQSHVLAPDGCMYVFNSCVFIPQILLSIIIQFVRQLCLFYMQVFHIYLKIIIY